MKLPRFLKRIKPLKVLNDLAYLTTGNHVHDYGKGEAKVIAGQPFVVKKCRLCDNTIQVPLT